MNLPRHLVPEIVGEANVLADFGEEQWVVVHRPPLPHSRLPRSSSSIAPRDEVRLLRAGGH